MELFLGPAIEYGTTVGPIGLDISTVDGSVSRLATFGFDIGSGGGVSRMKVKTTRL